MKTGLLLTGVAILLPGTWAIGGAGEDDLGRMAGNWSVVIVETAGKDSSAQDRKFKMNLVIHGDKYVIFMEDERLAMGNVRLDPSTKPASIDVVPIDGPHKGKVQAGIYAFQGDNMWTVFAAPGQPRPIGFKTRPESTESMFFYRRSK